MRENFGTTKLGAVLIPAYNSQPFLGDLLSRLKSVLGRISGWKIDVLLMDDGSQPPLSLDPDDDSFLLHRNEVNRGKGRTLKEGFRYFLNEHDYLPEFIITIDSDLQHRPEDIPGLIRAWEAGKGGIIYGARSRSLAEMPLHRILSNSLTSLIISFMVGQRIDDSQCGFRLYSTRLLAQLDLQEERFHLESEIMIRAGWEGARLAAVPIPTVYNSAPSAIRNLPDTLNFITLILRLGWKRIRGDV